MTNIELKEMANYFLKTLFYGIPEIEVSFNENKDIGCNGMFNLSIGNNYCEEDDCLRNEYFYRTKYVYMGNGVGYYDNAEMSWQDVENAPERKIVINKNLRIDKRMVVATLLHELCHYYLWYIGRGYDDADKDFLELCHKMDIPTNYDHEWDGSRYINTYNYLKIDKYIEIYEKEALLKARTA